MATRTDKRVEHIDACWQQRRERGGRLRRNDARQLEGMGGMGGERRDIHLAYIFSPFSDALGALNRHQRRVSRDNSDDASRIINDIVNKFNGNDALTYVSACVCQPPYIRLSSPLDNADAAPQRVRSSRAIWCCYGRSLPSRSPPASLFSSGDTACDNNGKTW